jgi:hypothetical protein
MGGEERRGSKDPFDVMPKNEKWKNFHVYLIETEDQLYYLIKQSSIIY